MTCSGALKIAGLLAASAAAAAPVLPAEMANAYQVRLLPGSPFHDRQELHRTGYVGRLDPDRLLFDYRKLAGLPQPTGDDSFRKKAAYLVAEPADWLAPADAATLTFKAHDAGPASGIVFQPLHAVHHERYSVYWKLSDTAARTSSASDTAPAASERAHDLSAEQKRNRARRRPRLTPRP
jgi:hypothetical protein